ncbi:MAG: VWA domain-containing protein [Gammaproteobacteria bacterium]|nr:VWA domain-containing protein [Gammaproteobacteria bacterium]
MFVIAFPWAFVLLPLPLLIWKWVAPAKASVSAALKVPFFQAVLHLVNRDRMVTMRRTSLIFLCAAWCALIVAAAGPRWVGPPVPLAREGYNIVLALDISPSMGVNDILDHRRRVTRLYAVKRAAKQFVSKRVGDKIGLILFGEQAYLLTPLTYDRRNVAQRIDDATVGLAGKSTSIGDALGLAIKRLQQVPAAGRMIVLLTDGVSNSGVLSPNKAAALARSEGIQVNTIGLHSAVDPQSFDGLFMNMGGAADLDEATLKAVAETTGGRYFRATDQASLERIYAFIDRMTRVSQDQAELRPQYEYYPWFLALAWVILLGLLGVRSGLTLIPAAKRGVEHG